MAEQNKLLLDEPENLRTITRRLWRENKLAAASAVLILLFLLLAALAPVITPYGFDEIVDAANRLAPPSTQHLLGTDEVGRDVLTRMLYGARISLLVGIVPTVISMLAGAVLGILAGYLGGRVDSIIMRLADIMLAFPSMLLAMVIMYTLGDGIINIFLALALVNWASVARIVRAETLKLRETEYVEAARSIGVGRFTIMRRHILPNCIPSMIVLFTLNIPSAILSESSLSFLGLGIQKPMASWGLMVNTGRQYLYTNPWLSLAPSIAIMLIVLAFNFLGDGLRDVLDPHLKKQ
ncbi:MAG: ABC transporter permease [Oscillospiraceae bacterium]|nr:ABC transporter permease [Oscillospiraceae bacterium]